MAPNLPEAGAVVLCPSNPNRNPNHCIAWPLTPSTPAVPSCCYSKGPAPYWPNPQVLIFDIWELWCLGLGTMAPKCQKLKNGGLDQYGKL